MEWHPTLEYRAVVQYDGAKGVIEIEVRKVGEAWSGRVWNVLPVWTLSR